MARPFWCSRKFVALLRIPDNNVVAAWVIFWVDGDGHNVCIKGVPQVTLAVPVIGVKVHEALDFDREPKATENRVAKPQLDITEFFNN